MKQVRLSNAHASNRLMAAPHGDFLTRLRATPLAALEAAMGSLTDQERVVLDLLVRGDCNKDICKTLDIEITTAKAHTSRIFKKLGVKNRVQAAVFGLWTTLIVSTARDAMTIDWQDGAAAGAIVGERDEDARRTPAIAAAKATIALQT